MCKGTSKGSQPSIAAAEDKIQQEMKKADDGDGVRYTLSTT